MGVGNPNFFLHISFSWVEIRLHTEFQRPMLMASLAPARDEIEAGVVAKADQYLIDLHYKQNVMIQLITAC